MYPDPGKLKDSPPAGGDEGLYPSSNKRFLLQLKKRIEIDIEARKFVAFDAIERGIGWNEVPDEVMRYKTIRNKMFNRIVAGFQKLVCIDTGYCAQLSQYLVPIGPLLR